MGTEAAVLAPLSAGTDDAGCSTAGPSCSFPARPAVRSSLRRPTVPVEGLSCLEERQAGHLSHTQAPPLLGGKAGRGRAGLQPPPLVLGVLEGKGRK